MTGRPPRSAAHDTAAGLVWGRELSIDATKVAANDSIPSLVPRFYFDATTHVADLFGDEGDAAPHADTDLPLGIVQLPTDSGRVPPAGDPPWRLLEERRLDPHRPTVGSYQRTTDVRVSPTDSNATPMRTGAATMVGYHDHYVVDGDKARIILAALVTPADVMENVPLRDLLWRVCFRRKLRPHQVTGDTTYGTVENIVAVENAGNRAFFPLPDFNHRTAFFGRDAFAYDAARDVDRCPGSQELRFRTHKHTERVRIYQAPAAACNACALKVQCTIRANGRQLKRSVDEAYLDRVRGYHATEAYQTAMRTNPGSPAEKAICPAGAMGNDAVRNDGSRCSRYARLPLENFSTGDSSSGRSPECPGGGLRPGHGAWRQPRGSE